VGFNVTLKTKCDNNFSNALYLFIFVVTFVGNVGCGAHCDIEWSGTMGLWFWIVGYKVTILNITFWNAKHLNISVLNVVNHYEFMFSIKILNNYSRLLLTNNYCSALIFPILLLVGTLWHVEEVRENGLFVYVRIDIEKKCKQVNWYGHSALYNDAIYFQIE